jgi:hypothetical protein
VLLSMLCPFEYDRELGISYWTKNYRTGIELEDPEALDRRYPYYDNVLPLAYGLHVGRDAGELIARGLTRLTTDKEGAWHRSTLDHRAVPRSVSGLDRISFGCVAR